MSSNSVLCLGEEEEEGREERVSSSPPFLFGERRKLGSGSFGELVFFFLSLSCQRGSSSSRFYAGTVFAGVENRTGRQVAIKIEPLSEPLSLSFRFVSPSFERSWLNFDGLVCVEWVEDQGFSFMKPM